MRKSKKRGENHPNWKGGVGMNNIAIFDTLAPQIEFCEEVRRDPTNYSHLQVRCTYCGRWYNPSRTSVRNRIQAVLGRYEGEQRLYCSFGCKKLCPIYMKKKYSAEETNTKRYSREVQPELRQLVFERDNYKCQKCGFEIYLQCHHIDGILQEPLLSADVDECITLCKGCHKEVHKEDECRYVDLKCPKN